MNVKDAIKREESDARISSPEREYARLQVKAVSKRDPLVPEASPSVNTECPAVSPQPVCPAVLPQPECPAVLPQGSSVPHASSLVSPLNGSSASSLVSPFHGDHGAPSGDSAQRFGRCDVSPNLQRLLDVLKGPMSVKEMMAALNFHSRDKFLKNYLSPALKAGLVEMKDPSSPKSPKQRYRRTDSSSEY